MRFTLAGGGMGLHFLSGADKFQIDTITGSQCGNLVHGTAGIGGILSINFYQNIANGKLGLIGGAIRINPGDDQAG